MLQAALLSILKQPQSYVFQLQLPGARHSAAVLLATLPPTPEAARNLRDQVEKTAQLLNDLIVHRRPPGQPDDTIAPDPLLGLGRLIYNQLFPPTIQQALQEISSEVPLILVTNDPELPWELAHDDEDYLALKHAVARQMLTHQPPRHNVMRRGRLWASLLVGNPTGDLREADEEIEQLSRLIDAIPGTARPRILMRRRATKEAVLQALASGAYDLIHYSGHATFDPQNPDASGLVLAGDQVLTATEIAKNLGGQPMVFLNACESARGRGGAEEAEGLVYLGLAVQGLASAFIQGGAQGFVGTFWPVHDLGSRNFALAFYRSALQREVIGEALRRARADARRAGPKDPLWASFMLYGDPHISLLPVKKTERRPATVLVARLLSLETLFEEVHEEEAAAVVEEYVAALSAQIAYYGGQIHSLAHDTLVGTFGISTTHQNDAERAVRAALGMREILVGLRPDVERSTFQRSNVPRLELGLGLSSGDVFVGDVGKGEREMSAVVGEVVNQAAWLARQADDGTILIAESVQRLTGRLFSLAPQSLAGPHESEILTVYQVLGLKPEPGPPWEMPGRQTAMIGRQRELAMLQEAWQMCQQGQGQLVGVVGEAGVGKSRLLYDFRIAFDDSDANWLTAVCPSAYSPGPYALVAQLLQAVLGLTPAEDKATVKDRIHGVLQRLLGADVPEQDLLESQAILGDILGIPCPDISLDHLDPKVRQRRLVDVLERLLAQGTSKFPLMVALEDLHRVDDASLEVLNQLIVGIDQLPILVVTLFRSEAEWQPPWWNRRNYHPVHLDTLDEAGSQALLAALLEVDEVAEDIAGVVLSRSGGNPLFIREWVAWLQESGFLSRSNGKWRLTCPPDEAAVPGTLQRVILTRVEGLPKAAQQVLAIAAVAGDNFEHPVLGAVVVETGDESTLDEGLAQLEEREFIYRRWGEEVYHFTHALVQEVAYESLLVEERRRYHRRLGRAMEQVYAGRETEVLELLAHHFYRSVTLPDVLGASKGFLDEAKEREKAKYYLQRAGEQAAALFANVEAVGYFSRALDLTVEEDLPARTALHFELGKVLMTHGEYDDSLGHLTEAYDLLGDVPGEATVLRRTRACFHIGRIYEQMGGGENLDTALEWQDRGLALLPEEPTAEAAMLHASGGMVKLRQGHFDQAVEKGELSLSIAQASDAGPEQALAHRLLSVAFHAQGHLDLAVEHARNNIEICEKLSDEIGLAKGYSNLGVFAFEMDEWPLAQESYLKALKRLERVGEAFEVARAYGNLGDLFFHVGQIEEGIAYAQRSLGLFTELGSFQGIIVARVILSTLLWRLSDLEGAEAQLLEAKALAEEVVMFRPTVARWLTQVYLTAGDVTQAETELQNVLSLDVDVLADDAEPIQRLRGQVLAAQGKADEAVQVLEESLARLTQKGARYQAGLTSLALASVLAQMEGRVVDAIEHAKRARAILADLGARPDVEEANELLANLGVRKR